MPQLRKEFLIEIQSDSKCFDQLIDQILQHVLLDLKSMDLLVSEPGYVHVYSLP